MLIKGGTGVTRCGDIHERFILNLFLEIVYFATWTKLMHDMRITRFHQNIHHMVILKSTNLGQAYSCSSMKQTCIKLTVFTPSAFVNSTLQTLDNNVFYNDVIRYVRHACQRLSLVTRCSSQSLSSCSNLLIWLMTCWQQGCLHIKSHVRIWPSTTSNFNSKIGY